MPAWRTLSSTICMDAHDGSRVQARCYRVPLVCSAESNVTLFTGKYGTSLLRSSPLRKSVRPWYLLIIAVIKYSIRKGNWTRWKEIRQSGAAHLLLLDWTSNSSCQARREERYHHHLSIYLFFFFLYREKKYCLGLVFLLPSLLPPSLSLWGRLSAYHCLEGSSGWRTAIIACRRMYSCVYDEHSINSSSVKTGCSEAAICENVKIVFGINYFFVYVEPTSCRAFIVSARPRLPNK